MTVITKGLNFSNLVAHLTDDFKHNVSQNKTSLFDVFSLSPEAEKHLKLLITQDEQKEKVSNI
jgi:hypothetical protein